MNSSQNMNTKCFCNHPLSSHHVTGGCGACDCKGFTERLTYRCDICNELLSILDAPNKEVMRVRFKDDGRNYAHTKCFKGKPPQTPFGPRPDAPRRIISIFFDEPDLQRILGVLFQLGAYEPDGAVDTQVVQDEQGQAALTKLFQRLSK